MAKKSQVIRAARPHKFQAQDYHRCLGCGRARAFMRRFGLCRHCFRQRAQRGELPGVTKSSW